MGLLEKIKSAFGGGKKEEKVETPIETLKEEEKAPIVPPVTPSTPSTEEEEVVSESEEEKPSEKTSE